MEISRCLLFEKKFSKKFWAKAITILVYLLNRLPTKVLKGMTPIKAWSGTKPLAQHLRVFGCVSDALVLENKRSKLNQKAVVRIYLGYNSEAKRYRIYNLETKKVMVSKNVKFNEGATWNWENEAIEPTNQI